jgi:HPt (histidine-containing phosphotransfer) domain-containing protein
MASKQWFDLARANEFGFEETQVRELVITFEQSLEEEMAIIQAALAAGDGLKVQHALHALKGFMPLFTEPGLAQAITDLYQTSREQPLGVTAPLFTALVPNLSSLLVEVQAWLAAPTAYHSGCV